MTTPRQVPVGLRRIARHARRQGWSIEQRRSGHLRWTSPTGAYVTTSASPSCGRALDNALADLRRHGLRPPRAGKQR